MQPYSVDEVAERLDFADLIYIVGGAQAILPKLFREIGFDKLLPQLLDNKVIMGYTGRGEYIGEANREGYF